jgi:MshEN domain
VPPRIGELLVKAGVCDPNGVRAALQNQVIFGGRIGTNLLEIGRVTEGALADALGRRHGAPALSGDLKLDPAVLALLRADVADRHDVVPYLLSGRRLAILVVDPSDLTMLDEVAFATSKQVHPIVVPEARLWALLRTGYGIDRQLRGIDVDFGSLQRAVAAPAAELSSVAAVSQDLIDEGEFAAIYGKAGSLDAPPPAETPAPEEEIVELTDLLAPEPEVAPIVLAALEAGAGHAPPARFESPPPERREEPEPAPLGFDAAVAALEGVTDRNAIARTVLRYARSRFRRAALLTVNRGVALGWQGTGDGLAGGGAGRLRIALGTPGALETVARTRAHFLGPLPKTEANVRLLKQLAGGVPGNALVVPILALGRVVNLIYADAGRGRMVDPTGVGELLILATRIARSYESLVARVR